MDKNIFQLRPPTEYCTCIICHKENVQRSDEHIIPMALGGYMHSYNVCKECNSKFGSTVDPLLVNHYMLKWERYKHQLRGESKTAIPHPFIGTHEGEDGGKYRLQEEKGMIVPHLIQKVDFNEETHVVTLQVDANDEEKIDDILKKVCQRRGLNYKKPSTPRKVSYSSGRPTIKMSVSIDIAQFRLGIVKIAYEFTAELISGYTSDSTAKIIAEILQQANAERLDEIKFAGDGFHDVFKKTFDDYIDFENDHRHYLLLLNIDGKLYCFVKLFNVFVLGVMMSQKEYPLANHTILAINDFYRHDFELLTLGELVTRISSFVEERVVFAEPWNAGLQVLNRQQQVAFYRDENGTALCFTVGGDIIGPTTDVLKSVPENRIEDKIENGFQTSKYNMQGHVWFCMNPTRQLVPVKEIVLVTRIAKL